MAQNFPNNPTTGTTTTINGEVWVYDGYGWVRTVVSANIDGGTPTTNYGGTSTVNGGSP